MSQRTKLPGNTDCYRKLLQLSVERGLSSEWIPSQSSRGNQRYCQMARYVVLCYLLLKQLICGRVCCCFSLPGAPIVWLPCLCFVVSCVFSGWTAADISFHQHMEYLSQSWLVLLMMHPTWAVWGSPNHTDWTHWLGASLLAHPSIHVLHVIISWFFLFEYLWYLCCCAAVVLGIYFSCLCSGSDRFEVWSLFCLLSVSFYDVSELECLDPNINPLISTINKLDVLSESHQHLCPCNTHAAHSYVGFYHTDCNTGD